MYSVELVVETCEQVRLILGRRQVTWKHSPQALQIVCPLSSLRHNGVIVVPQFWHAIMTVASWLFSVCMAFTSIGVGSSAACSAKLKQPFCLCMTLTCVLLDTRLLNAGHPLQPSAPPVPLQRPPPGHVPVGVCSAET